MFSSDDGQHLLFATTEPLANGDLDVNFDTYEHFQGVTELVSQGPLAGGGDSSGAIPVGISADGSRTFFRSQEPITADDTDQRMDVYERFAGETTLVSGGPLAGGGDAADVANFHVAGDGTLLFTTFEPLTNDDSDLNEDVYTSRLVAPALAGPEAGQPPGGAAPTEADTLAPALTQLRIRPARIAIGRSLPVLASALRQRTTISFRLSEEASVRISFARARPGRRVGGRCRRPSPRNADRPRCTRFVTVRTRLGFAGLSAGQQRIRFSGRLTRRRSLEPGLHRVTARPTDELGNRGAARSARLTLVRRSR